MLLSRKTLFLFLCAPPDDSLFEHVFCVICVCFAVFLRVLGDLYSFLCEIYVFYYMFWDYFRSMVRGPGGEFKTVTKKTHLLLI